MSCAKKSIDGAAAPGPPPTPRSGGRAPATLIIRPMPDHADAPLTIAGFQQLIRQRYYDTDAARGTPATFMWLIEEVGELATALHKAAGQGGKTSGGDDPAGEFADVLAWLCTLANINGIDLDAAVRDKYLSDKAPAGHK